MITYWTKEGRFVTNDWFSIPESVVFHRIDGPAVERSDGGKLWYYNGNLHREDGPAIERARGTKYWYLYGDQHRDDGPAVEYPDGTTYWCMYGKEYSLEEFVQQTPFLTSDAERLSFYLRWK